MHACQVRNVLLFILPRREEKKETKERERGRGAYEKHQVWILSLIRYQMNNSTSKSYTHICSSSDLPVSRYGTTSSSSDLPVSRNGTTILSPIFKI